MKNEAHYKAKYFIPKFDNFDFILSCQVNTSYGWNISSSLFLAFIAGGLSSVSVKIDSEGEFLNLKIIFSCIMQIVMDSTLEITKR